MYTVKAGDTISAILAEQQLELAELQAANPSLATSAAVYIGQRLFLPPWDASCPSDPLASLPPCRNVTVKVRLAGGWGSDAACLQRVCMACSLPLHS